MSCAVFSVCVRLRFRGDSIRARSLFPESLSRAFRPGRPELGPAPDPGQFRVSSLGCPVLLRPLAAPPQPFFAPLSVPVRVPVCGAWGLSPVLGSDSRSGQGCKGSHFMCRNDAPYRILSPGDTENGTGLPPEPRSGRYPGR